MSSTTDANPVFVLIPAYQPSEQLPMIVRSLAESPSVRGVVVVDDGSSAEYSPLFEQIERVDKAHVVRHAENLGKGAALKTGMDYGVRAFDDVVGVVTADADGQHRVDDILAVAEALRSQPDQMILGVREFGNNVPFANRFGNIFTRHILKLVVGQSISDTQTGLRGIPLRMIGRLLELKSTGYEFELDMLLQCKFERIRIAEIGIQTIYAQRVRISHFSPFMDSMRIYFVLLRFLMISLITAVLDNMVFALVYFAWQNILGSQVVGRVGATTFNYFANKKTVFRSDAPDAHTMPKYLLLVVFSGGVSYGLILLLVSITGMSPILAKILAETLVFVFNFVVQRDIVFAPSGGRKLAA